MSLYEEPDRLLNKLVRDLFDGMTESAGLADSVIRIAALDVKVKPGFVPMSKSPNKDGFIPVRYVGNLNKLAVTEGKRKRNRKLVPYAPGLPKRSERVAGVGPVAVSSGKSRDHKGRKGVRARRAIDRFLSEVDRGLAKTRRLRTAIVLRDEMSELLTRCKSEPSIRALFTFAERKRIRDTMRRSAYIIRRLTQAGVTV